MIPFKLKMLDLYQYQPKKEKKKRLGYLKNLWVQGILVSHNRLSRQSLKLLIILLVLQMFIIFKNKINNQSIKNKYRFFNIHQDNHIMMNVLSKNLFEVC